MLGFNTSPMKGQNVTWTGGQLDKFDRFRVPDGYLYRANNVTVEDGIIKRHLGWHRQTKQVAGAPSGKSMDGLYAWRAPLNPPSTGIGDWMVGFISGAMVVYNPNTDAWVPTAGGVDFTFTVTNKPDYTTYDTKLIGCAGGKGFSLTINPGGAAAYASALTLTGSPKPRLCQVYKDRIAILSDNPTNKIVFTDIGSLTITNESAQSFYLRDMGDPPTGITADEDRLYVFYADAIYAVEGTGRFSWTSRPFFTGIGCEAKDSIVRHDGWIYFTNRRGIYRFNGGTAPQQIFSFYDRMREDGASWISMPDGSTFNQRINAEINPYSRHYVLAYASAGATATNRGLLLHLDNMAVTQMSSLPAASMTFHNGRLKFGASMSANAGSPSGIVYQFSIPTDSNRYLYSTQTYTVDVTTGFYNLGDPYSEKEFVVMDVMALASSSGGSIRVDASIDGKADITLATVSIAPTGTLYGDFESDTGTRGFVKSYNILSEGENKTGRYIGYRFRASGQGQNTIYGLNHYARARSNVNIFGLP